MALDPLTAGLDLAKTLGSIIERFIPDKQKAAEAAQALQAELLKQQGEQNAGQIEINKVEAANPNLWVSGARPAVMWVCAAAFAWACALEPMLTWACYACGHSFVPPEMPMGVIMEVLGAMLGLGTLRTWEKLRGIEPPTVATMATKEVRRATAVR